MSQELWTDVDRYICDRLIPADPVLEQVLAASRAAGLPPISVSAGQGMLLNLLARISRAQSILEVGTLGGYSTIWLARALPAGGRLVTLEADPHYADVARANIAAAGLQEIVELHVGPALDTLPRLAAAGLLFDLIFIDADKRNYPGYLECALELSRPGTVIVADNVVRDGAIVDDELIYPEAGERENVDGVRRLFEMLGTDARLTATAIQTVGEKGYDGFAVALVTDSQPRP